MPSKKSKKSSAKASEAQIQAANPPMLRYTHSSRASAEAALYDVKFNWLLKPGEPLICAVAGDNQVRIYECEEDGDLKFLTAFQDTTDSFFCCAWSCDSKYQPLLAAAGQKGVIRLFDIGAGSVLKNFLGHTQSVNDLKFHPRDTNLMFSGSKDHSVRLWNIKTDILVVIFHGEMGHRDEVISIDVDPFGMRLVSGGMDHAIKVWKLDDHHVSSAVKLSYVYNQKTVRPFPTFRQHFPDFTSRNIHGNYVDCVRWFGDLIISKACSVENYCVDLRMLELECTAGNWKGDHNNIVIWKAGKPFQKWSDINMSLKETECQAIARLGVDKCHCWFMRFALDCRNQVLALGNEVGQIFVYDLTGANPRRIQSGVLNHTRCTKAIRQTAFSRDGSVLVCVSDDGSIWRWDRSELSE